MTERRLSPVEEVVLDKIRQLRTAHRACSKEPLRRLVDVSNAYLEELVEGLKRKGVVSWSPGVPGSIHIVGEYDGQDPRRVTEMSDEELFALAGAMAGIAHMDGPPE